MGPTPRCGAAAFAAGPASPFSFDTNSTSTRAARPIPHRDATTGDTDGGGVLLRLRVQQRIENGRLPLLRPRRIDDGYGYSRRCCVCEELIELTKIEYQINHPNYECALSFACRAVSRPILRNAGRVLEPPKPFPALRTRRESLEDGPAQRDQRSRPDRTLSMRCCRIDSAVQGNGNVLRQHQCRHD